ncbi:hypothetical protein EYF80_039258 [Liparis tanakae]|uniref:Uncharacterized protein n=1 Tax=Liparis tanakae TaxID=230148 RepID=A0A4Z2GAC9_9TELE|nr:hypothetical protein EYF80_039258 [Liparis tanakae]
MSSMLIQLSCQHNYPTPSCVSGESPIHPMSRLPSSTVTLTPQGMLGVWECVSFSRSSWNEGSNRLQEQWKKTPQRN